MSESAAGGLYADCVTPFDVEGRVDLGALRAILEYVLSAGVDGVVVKVDSVEDLLTLEKRAGRLDIPKALIVDRGLTQIPPNTPTALGIGPGKASIIDAVTGELKLL